MTPLKPGSRISHYRILQQLGQGGQATAYKAEDTRLNRQVVVKILLPELTTSAAARKRFEREARLASALDHPNICAIYDIGEGDGLFYIVMPFIAGRTVKEVISGEPLELLSALSIAAQIADALALAHSRGIVHRDIKPNNLIVNDQGQVKVLDFGLAKMLSDADAVTDADTDKSVTEVGVPYGTMGYGSPEQAAGERIDHRTDIFSLGVVLYEMVTGRQPFKGRNRIETLHSVINDLPAPISDFNPRLPDALQAILDRALAKKPRDRYAQIAEMRDELRRLMRDLAQDAGLPTDFAPALVAPQRARTGAWRLTGALGRVLPKRAFGRGRNSNAPNASQPANKSDRAMLRAETTRAETTRVEAASRATAPLITPRSEVTHADRSVPTDSGSALHNSWGGETKQTIAVLPFKNLAGNAEDDFYSVSLADGIITELAHLRALIVRPSSYIARYAGREIDPKQVGEELAVASVLVGSYIKTPDRFRVTAQLIATATGQIAWSEKIDIAERDLITIQDTIAERVIAGLKVQLTEEEQERIETPATTNPEAYEFFLRGRDLLFQYMSHSFDDRDLDDAIKMFEESVRLDPNFARAHAALGRCYVHHAQGYGGNHYFELAEASLKRALEIDPKYPSARLQMVYVYLHHGEKERALSTLAEVRRDAPNDPTVFIIAGLLYRLNGLYDKALKQYDRLLELNPRDLVIVSYNRGRLHSYRHEYDEAIAEFEKGRRVEPDHPLIKTFLALTYFNIGRIDECQQLVEEVLREHPHFDPVQVLLAWCYSVRGRHDEARALITDHVKEIAAADPDVAVWLASFYAMENMRDAAVEWIGRAIHLGNENYPLFADNNRLDNLRCDLRFVNLMTDLKQRWEARR